MMTALRTARLRKKYSSTVFSNIDNEFANKHPPCVETPKEDLGRKKKLCLL